MSLARSFTQRFARKGDKQAAQLKPSKPSPQISLPVNLLSTSNSLAYDAPDLAEAQLQHSVSPFYPPETPTRNKFSGFSTPNNFETPTTEAPGLTDASSIEESSPVQPGDSYFAYKPVAPLRSKTVREASSSSSLSQEGTFDRPAIPKRAASHSKREHQRVHRSRSVQRHSTDSHAPSLSTASQSGRSSIGPGTPAEIDTQESVAESEWRTSFDILGRSGSQMDKSRRLTPSAPSPRSQSIERSNSTRGAKHDNPFSRELEQLEEVAEEFTGLADQNERDSDEKALVSRGLAKFSADEYLQEISGLEGVFLAGRDSRTALVNVEGEMHGWI